LPERDGGPSKTERELIAAATAGLSRYRSRAAAHDTIRHRRARNTSIADLVTMHWRREDLSVRERAMLGYAERVALRARGIGDSYHAALAETGFSQGEISDVGPIAAFCGLSSGC
jgi:uncharacterized peroxidase-related enzyme